MVHQFLVQIANTKIIAPSNSIIPDQMLINIVKIPKHTCTAQIIFKIRISFIVCGFAWSDKSVGRQHNIFNIRYYF